MRHSHYSDFSIGNQELSKPDIFTCIPLTHPHQHLSLNTNRSARLNNAFTFIYRSPFWGVCKGAEIATRWYLYGIYFLGTKWANPLNHWNSGAWGLSLMPCWRTTCVLTFNLINSWAESTNRSNALFWLPVWLTAKDRGPRTIDRGYWCSSTISLGFSIKGPGSADAGPASAVRGCMMGWQCRRTI